MAEKERPLCLLVSDPHLPWGYWPAIEALHAWAEEYHPQMIVLLGDVLDMYLLSRFSKSDLETISIKTVQDETGESWTRFVQPFLDLGVPMHMLAGNHEARWDSRMGEVPGLGFYHPHNPAAELCKTAGIKYHGAGEMLISVPGHKSVLAAHGWRSLKIPGMAAADCAVRAGRPFIQGHSHKLAGPIWLNRDVYAIEAGYLGNPAAPCFSYNKGRSANVNGWVHGSAYIDYDGGPGIIRL